MKNMYFYVSAVCFLVSACCTVYASDHVVTRSYNDDIVAMIEAGWEFRSKDSTNHQEIYYAKNKFTAPSKDDIVFLKNMNTITHLSIIGTDIVLPEVLGIPTLRHLELFSKNQELSLAFLENANSRCELESLRITGKVDYSTSIHVSSRLYHSVSHLKSLSIEQCEITATGLKVLMAIPTLESLQVASRFDGVSPDDYVVGKNLKQMHLFITGYISPDEMKLFAQKVTEANISNVRLTLRMVDLTDDQLICELLKIKRLRELNLFSCLFDESIVPMITSHKGIYAITISRGSLCE